MSRVPVYPIGGGPAPHEHNVADMLAAAFGEVAQVAAGLDEAINGSAEFVKSRVRRIQGALTRRVNGGQRMVDGGVRRAADQLDGRIANSTAELAGALRGVNGLVGTTRAIATELEQLRSPSRGLSSVGAPPEPPPPDPLTPPAEIGPDGRPQLGSFVSAAGGGEFVSTTEGILPPPPTESVTPIGVQIIEGDPPPPVLIPADAPPPALHPDLVPLVGPLPDRPCPPIQVHCPAPIVRVTVLPAPVQFVGGPAPSPWPTDAFAQGPPTGGGETVGFNPGLMAMAGDPGPLALPFELGREPPPPLVDPAEIMASFLQAASIALSLLR